MRTDSPVPAVGKSGSAIADLAPGLALDALVAEKVMGCKLFKNDFVKFGCGCEHRTNDIGLQPHGWTTSHAGLAPYSTSIAAAWEVVEKIKLLRDYVLTQTDSGTWGIYGWNYDFTSAPVIRWDEAVAEAPTAPHAICLAALKAVGGAE